MSDVIDSELLLDSLDKLILVQGATIVLIEFLESLQGGDLGPLEDIGYLLIDAVLPLEERVVVLQSILHNLKLLLKVLLVILDCLKLLLRLVILSDQLLHVVDLLSKLCIAQTEVISPLLLHFKLLVCSLQVR